ncbi:altronate dehydratase [Paraflavitalea soli]|uniref:Altronate dehydratase n=1 Tax=Paraflavitalea soli TaxID=2315862 RepID=A0A3B7MZV0_9BACT|nr:altronate dehydratase family protein [Paraflavitalea soli]AXY78620.1 altronate dehydratase [Paraflavitalea soli]
MGSTSYLQIHPADNVLVALKDLPAGNEITADEVCFTLKEPIKAKHKLAARDLLEGHDIIMYGVLVGRAVAPIPQGGLLTTKNIVHASNSFSVQERNLAWEKPDIAKFANRTFSGFHRADGKVGTANYWLVIPMVFCENRNVTILKEALVEKLGYTRKSIYQEKTAVLVELYQRGAGMEAILQADINTNSITGQVTPRLFENIDGIKFLTHDMGCGGTRSDSNALCGLLAGYIAHSNVAGATVLSLGCQHAQVDILKEEVEKRLGVFKKPLLVFEQQIEGTEEQLVNEALKQTFVGLVAANQQKRAPARLDKLCIGLECGGSDGFSGISANPAIGYTSDLLVALGGSVILSEFPELCGVEQDLSDRCLDETKAEKFIHLMKTYNALAEAGGSGFYANPSPGNIKDGLITDAIKSAGAAKKGGSSPVVDVLDYPEFVTKPGLNLLCTPGSDVESTTAEVGAGANIVLFTTGLGTPTGNPISPVIKLSTNTALAQKMPDIIDINCGTIIDGQETIEQAGERILNYVIDVASGNVRPKSVELEQDDFIPWKRGVSL